MLAAQILASSIPHALFGISLAAFTATLYSILKLALNLSFVFALRRVKLALLRREGAATVTQQI